MRKFYKNFTLCYLMLEFLSLNSSSLWGINFFSKLRDVIYG